MIPRTPAGTRFSSVAFGLAPTPVLEVPPVPPASSKGGLACKQKLVQKSSIRIQGTYSLLAGVRPLRLEDLRGQIFMDLKDWGGLRYSGDFDGGWSRCWHTTWATEYTDVRVVVFPYEIPKW